MSSAGIPTGSARAEDHHGEVTSERDLVASVDAAFAAAGHALLVWPDPHPDRSLLEEEYSRLTNPDRWHILGARADAWLTAVGGAGLARVERDVDIDWSAAPRTVISRTDRAVPYRSGGPALVFARSQIGDVADAGVTLGVGDPATCVAWFPDCGCDACDTGAQDELDHLDTHVLAIVTGMFRRLSKGDKVITTLGEGRWSASNVRGREVDKILASAADWVEVTGRSWLR